MGLQGLFVAVHADVRHAGGGDQVEDAVLEAQTCTEDGNDGHLLAGQYGHFAGAQRRLDGLQGGGQVTGGLVGQQHGDLAHQGAEVLDAGVLIAHHRQLVLHQRVIYDVQGRKLFVHDLILRILKFIDPPV